MTDTIGWIDRLDWWRVDGDIYGDACARVMRVIEDVAYTYLWPQWCIQSCHRGEQNSQMSAWKRRRRWMIVICCELVWHNVWCVRETPLTCIPYHPVSCVAAHDVHYTFMLTLMHRPHSPTFIHRFALNSWMSPTVLSSVTSRALSASVISCVLWKLSVRPVVFVKLCCCWSN